MAGVAKRLHIPGSERLGTVYHVSKLSDQDDKPDFRHLNATPDNLAKTKYHLINNANTTQDATILIFNT